MSHSVVKPIDTPDATSLSVGEYSISKKRRKNPFSGYFADAPVMLPVDGSAAVFLNPDPVVISEGGASGLGVYDKTLADDGHLRGLWGTRVHAVIGLGYEVIAAGEDQEHIEDAEFGRQILAGIQKFDNARAELMKYRIKGYAVGEIVWQTDGATLYIEKIKPHDPRMFVFGAPAGELRLTLSDDGRETIALDPRKFFTLVHDGSAVNPYGVGLGQTVFYLALYKKHALQNWHVMGDKHSTPTMDNTYKAGVGIDEDRMLELAEQATTQAAVAHDDTITLTPLNTAGATNPDIHDKQISRLNDEMSVAIIGQVLSSTPVSTGLGNGQASLQAQVKRDVLEADAQDQENMLNELLRLAILFNRGARAPNGYPRARVKTEDETDQRDEAEAIEILSRTGVPIPLRWALEKFGIPEVQDDEPVLETPGLTALPGIGGGGGEPAPTDTTGSEPEVATFAERTQHVAAALTRHDDGDARDSTRILARMIDGLRDVLDTMQRTLLRSTVGKRAGTRKKN